MAPVYAKLRRPAVDPAIPQDDRALLTAPGTLLTPACRGRPARRRDFLPRVPGRRMATVDGAAFGLTGAMMIAVFGATPLAVGVLGLQAATSWESASSHYALVLAEAIAIIQFAIASSELSGPVNAVTPNPMQNSDFTRVLAKAMHRPALFPAPPFALRLALGEMADALLLSSQRVLPSRLVQSGYTFVEPDLASALGEMFQK